MLKKEVIIKNKTGLHARPAAVFVEAADRFESDVEIIFDGIAVNAKSIIGVLSLGIGKGDQITLVTEGSDEKEALEYLIEIIENSFGENGGGEYDTL
ncbi:HPr family phosphocarrier protein [Iocasia frigidifontis]|uniref:Phosphocarrier protein HPr n=1 Tax=Iocasia fonsfrigidae TaxID=2682810 RepID=A0A8A7KK70_9FIRM|nr:HPr family phosphocarrier protein [Iocasia fonsfrigidae]MTI60531.1 HPr family phosphocarrier protein [Bacillota bacterium]QTL99247.1 HPr family phosphocarrier protein [Iocasia fonsfrigidae]